VRDLEQHEPRADGLDGVEHVVEPARQVVDVLALERGHERPVELGEQLVGHAVGLVLDRLELLGALIEPVETLHHLVEQVGALSRQLGLAPEQREEVLLLGEQGDHRVLSRRARRVGPPRRQRVAGRPDEYHGGRQTGNRPLARIRPRLRDEMLCCAPPTRP